MHDLVSVLLLQKITGWNSKRAGSLKIEYDTSRMILFV